ncbi:hypothetical protein Q765_01110 [Flavobacterium rivuli WB 3.3-2 = DSM 21788]|uniref:Uncharacterized protein n=1 Tax=Flavobacterium rivuli WB 3.3-2 = DSM 21788 TaxID=1121895 RepID=A0A0A2M7A2_9FLAO|nr:hypothetical protein [Flavobacterium rivuli]KGO88537.1 hypothetical protein Q765_01110 [Flavobacterium rivuli WB 3.3-2 = DSM 21788]
MKYILSLLLLFLLCLKGNCQSIKKLEYELSFYKSGEVYGDKIMKAKLLQSKDPFNKKAIRYICEYYNDRKIDSVNIFFDRLIAKFPNKTEPYLLSYDFANYFKINNIYETKLAYLLKANDIEAENIEAVYKLAELYYKDFIYPLKMEIDYGKVITGDKEWDSVINAENEQFKNRKKESYFKNPEIDAYKYFERLWELSPKHRLLIYFPIKQLECILRKSSVHKKPVEVNNYFQPGHFANLSENWECDFSKDLLYEVESSFEHDKWLSEQLKDLKEISLYKKQVLDDIEIYRFTWLRSFHNPIALRIEKSNNDVTLYYSIGKGMGGYKPIGLKKRGSKKLTLTEWDNFVKLLSNGNYRELPNYDSTLMTDGAVWLLEYKTHDTYEAKADNNPGKNIYNSCIYLLRISGIKIPDYEIY